MVSILYLPRVYSSYLSAPSQMATTVVVTQPAVTTAQPVVFRDRPVIVTDSNGQQVLYVALQKVYNICRAVPCAHIAHTHTHTTRHHTWSALTISIIQILGTGF